MNEQVVNEIYALQEPDAWQYIDSKDQVYDINLDYSNVITYTIRTAKSIPVVLHYWWQVLEYFEDKN